LATTKNFIKKERLPYAYIGGHSEDFIKLA